MIRLHDVDFVWYRRLSLYRVTRPRDRRWSHSAAWHVQAMCSRRISSHLEHALHAESRLDLRYLEGRIVFAVRLERDLQNTDSQQKYPFDASGIHFLRQ